LDFRIKDLLLEIFLSKYCDPGHQPDPAITTSMNGGPWDDTLITALEKPKILTLHLYT
jgi:hypothetical protein